MATSGSKNFSLTRNDIINAALRKIGEYDKGETPSGPETADASEALNVLVNELAGVHGADIFLRTELTLFLQKGQAKYLLGPSGDHVTESYVETELAAARVLGSQTMLVDSEVGISAGDYIGIKLDDGSIDWTTVNGTPTLGSITIVDGLTSPADVDNKVYAYTTKAYRPIALFAALRRDSSDLDNEIILIGEKEYFDLTDKSSEGVPNSISYRASLDSGALFVWPTGDGATDKIVSIAHYYPDDFDAASDNAQFPVEWSSALIWGLAAELGPEYGLPEREQMKNFNIAAAKRERALDADFENASVIFARA